MQCPSCTHENFKVLGTTKTSSHIRRRKECNCCGLEFSTYEIFGSRYDLLCRSHDFIKAAQDLFSLGHT